MFGIPTCHTSTNLGGLLVNSQVSGRFAGMEPASRHPPVESSAVRTWKVGGFRQQLAARGVLNPNEPRLAEREGGGSLRRCCRHPPAKHSGGCDENEIKASD